MDDSGDAEEEEQFHVDAILDSKIEDGEEFFLVRWKGYGGHSCDYGRFLFI